MTSDGTFRYVLERRWEEAHACWPCGEYRYTTQVCTMYVADMFSIGSLSSIMVSLIIFIVMVALVKRNPEKVLTVKH